MPQMASSKPDRSSDPPRKIRIVGKIRGFTHQESENLKDDDVAPWISLRKTPEGKVAIAFGDQSTKDVYEVDDCYQPDQDNKMIFEREIKPFLPEVVDGQNVTVIAYGAKGSGKTYTVQGNEENQGLASLAISEVISCLEGNGKGNLVAVSFYEVYQDHVHDILNPTRPEIQLLEDAQGRVTLKGLSQVFVKSTSEFQKLYPKECASLCETQKKPPQLARRSHKGLIIRVLSNHESSSAKLLGKINFVDLAGYEDAKRTSSEGMNLSEKNKVKESLHSLLKVVYALNAKETHVPYRESKLTRLLRDSLGKKGHTVMFTCLNPLFCQDTIYATSLASRACQSVNRTSTTSTKKSSSSNQMTLTSLANGRPGNVSDSMKKSTTRVVSDSMKKSTTRVVSDSMKKSTTRVVSESMKKSTTRVVSESMKKSTTRVVSDSMKKSTTRVVSDSMKKSTTSRANPKKKTPLLVKGRKLFDDEKQPSSAKQVQSQSNIAPVMQSVSISDSGSVTLPSSQDELQSQSNIAPVMQSVSVSDSGSVTLPSSQDEEKSTSNTSSAQVLKEEVEESSVEVCPTTTTENEGDSSAEVSALDDSNKKDLTCPEDGNTLEKENVYLPMKDREDKVTNEDMGNEKCLSENEGGSPPLSERLRDLSNYLKSLQSPTPPTLNVHGTNHLVDHQVVSTDIEEPKTPVVRKEQGVADKWEHKNLKTPSVDYQVVSTDIEEPKTPVLQKEQGVADTWEHEILKTPSETFAGCSTGFKQSFVNEYLNFLNTADKQKLRSLRGIGEKRAKYILELREESPQPFKDLDDLKDIGLSSVQIKKMLKDVAGQLFT